MLLEFWVIKFFWRVWSFLIWSISLQLTLLKLSRPCWIHLTTSLASTNPRKNSTIKPQKKISHHQHSNHQTQSQCPFMPKNNFFFSIHSKDPIPISFNEIRLKSHRKKNISLFNGNVKTVFNYLSFFLLLIFCELG